MQLTEKEKEILNRFQKFIYNNSPNNDLLVQIIELAGTYLNIQTISDYAKENGLSYNGVKNNREIRNIFNVRFVIDNK